MRVNGLCNVKIVLGWILMIISVSFMRIIWTSTFLIKSSERMEILGALLHRIVFKLLIKWWRFYTTPYVWQKAPVHLAFFICIKSAYHCMFLVTFTFRFAQSFLMHISLKGNMYTHKSMHAFQNWDLLKYSNLS